MVTEAVYLLNDWIIDQLDNDAQFSAAKALLPTPITIQPMIAQSDITPYIRYEVVPGFGDVQYVREDVVVYRVGDDKMVNIGTILEALLELTNLHNATALGIGDAQFKIQSVIFNGSTRPRAPDQQYGVFERGFSCRLIYTILS